MDAALNPYAAGAGTPPPELAGRDEILEDARVALTRIKAGRPATSQMLLGLRGVGKTVLLVAIANMARKLGYGVVIVETPENKSLPQILVPNLRQLLLQMDVGEQAAARRKAALRAVRNFASVFKVSIGGVEVAVEPETGVADSGHLAMDLTDLFVSVAEVARESDTAVAILIDEVQYLSQEDLEALIVAIHRIAQLGLPLTVFGAGLPQIAALAGEAKSYAERLFAFPEVGALDETAARNALSEPARRAGVHYKADALKFIIDATKGYPYFLQEWGTHTWNVAETSPITAAHVQAASERAIRKLDNGFFRVRLDRLTPREKSYMRAMAELGPGPHRSGEIAEALNTTVRSVAPIRQALIRKGMVYSPAHGDTAFTVPMFDDFMRRSMPDWSAGGNDE